MEIFIIWAVMMGFSLGMFALWLWSLIDVIQNAKDKVLWVLIIVFLSLPGSILWWVMGERESKRPVRGRTYRGRTPQAGARPRTSARPVRRRMRAQ